MSVLAVLLLFVLPRLRGRSPRWRCIIWSLTALRLLFPYKLLPQGMVSIALPPVAVQAADTAEALYGTGISTILLSEEESGRLELTAVVFCCVWAAGTGIFLAVHTASYVHFIRDLRRNGRFLTQKEILQGRKDSQGRRRGPWVYVSPAVQTPMLFGLLRPRILLPDREWNPEDLTWVWRHEMVHWRRGDLWIKHAALLVNAVFWWNPVVYWLRRQWNRDLELGCDERVVSGLSPQERIRYGEALLRLQAPEKPFSLMAAGFGGRKTLLRMRVENLLDTGKRKRGILIFTLALSGLLLSGSLVSVRAAEIPQLSQDRGQSDGLEAESAEASGIQWSWPLHWEGIQITSGYGCRWGFFHNGVDLAAEQDSIGLPIYPGASGTVVAVNQDVGDYWGRYVVIWHGDHWYSLYAHCRDVRVAVGQQVTPEDVIAHVGSTGNSTGPHLHFAIRRGEEYVNPMEYLPSGA